MFEMELKLNILARLQETFESIASSGNVSSIEGTFSFDTMSANATEFEKAYAEMSLMIEAAFADTSWGTYLTMRAAEFGVDRKKATYAIGEITAYGNKGAIVPKGTLFDVNGGAQFVTDEQCTIGEAGNATVKITCTSAGVAGNVAAGTINHIPVSLTGISKVSNAAATYDGYDEEEDKELLERYMIVVRTPATSGNKYHYYNWAMSIEGVGGCRVRPLWNGPGTVKVIIVNSNMQTASDEIIKKVVDYIEGQRPIGADVTVISPAPKTMNIKADVAGTLDKEAFVAAINAYLKKKNLDLKYISVAQVTDILMGQTGVIDCDNVTLNDGRRVTVSEDELLSVGEVIINELTS